MGIQSGGQANRPASRSGLSVRLSLVVDTWLGEFLVTQFDRSNLFYLLCAEIRRNVRLVRGLMMNI